MRSRVSVREAVLGFQKSMIAFPSISTGAYGFPVERASKIAIKEIKRALQFQMKVHDCYLKALREV